MPVLYKRSPFTIRLMMSGMFLTGLPSVIHHASTSLSVQRKHACLAVRIRCCRPFVCRFSFFLSPSLCLRRSSQPCGLCVSSCCCASRLPYLEPCAFDRGHPSRSWRKAKQRSTTTSPKFAAASSPLLCISRPSQRSPSQPEDGGTMLLSLLSQPQRRRLIPFFFSFFFFS